MIKNDMLKLWFPELNDNQLKRLKEMFFIEEHEAYKNGYMTALENEGLVGADWVDLPEGPSEGP